MALIAAHLVFGGRRFPGRHSTAGLQAGDVPCRGVRIGRGRRVSSWFSGSRLIGYRLITSRPIGVRGVVLRMVAFHGVRSFLDRLRFLSPALD